MTDRNFATAFTVDQSPETAFAAINNVRGWWSGNITGNTEKPGDEFEYRYEDMHRRKIKVAEIIPGKKIAWQVLENDFSFLEDKTEWAGTAIIFDIAKSGSRTEVRFTHQGLVPECECYDVCLDGWSAAINDSLQSLIATGKGHPNVG